MRLNEYGWDLEISGYLLYHRETATYNFWMQHFTPSTQCVELSRHSTPAVSWRKANHNPAITMWVKYDFMKPQGSWKKCTPPTWEEITTYMQEYEKNI